jgi:hypothetical protein
MTKASLAKARAAKVAKKASAVNPPADMTDVTDATNGVPVLDAEVAMDVPAALSAMELIAESLDRINNRLENLEGTQTTFTPMRPTQSPSPKADTYVPPDQLMKRAMREGLKNAGDQVAGRSTYLETPGELAKIPPAYRPVFHSGDQVRINPEATIYASADKRWGEILQDRNIEGVGEVLSIQYITKTYEPKYSVFVQGLTRATGDGFRESELLPLYG